MKSNDEVYIYTQSVYLFMFQFLQALQFFSHCLLEVKQNRFFYHKSNRRVICSAVCVSGICLVVLQESSSVIMGRCCLHLCLDPPPSSQRLHPTCPSCWFASRASDPAEPPPPHCPADSTEPSLWAPSLHSHAQVSACWKYWPTFCQIKKNNNNKNDHIYCHYSNRFSI